MTVREGTAGNDSLVGSWDGRTVLGGAGDDTLWGDASEWDSSDGLLVGGEGHDFLNGGASDGYDYDKTSPSGNDVLLGDAGDDTLFGGAGAGRDTLVGGAGSDLLTAGPGDLVIGGAGRDTFTLFGGVGVIRIEDFEPGEMLDPDEGYTYEILAGDDPTMLQREQLMVGTPSAGTTRIYFGYDDNPGAERLVELVGDFVASRFLWTRGVLSYLADEPMVDVGGGRADFMVGGLLGDTLQGGGGRDSIMGMGGDDLLQGNAEGDRLQGDGGSDVLEGGAGADDLFGGDGADTLYGGDDADWLSGDAGDDVMIGGAGADSFSSAPGQGRDRIVDFSTGDVLYVPVRLFSIIDGDGTRLAQRGQLVVQRVAGSQTILDFGMDDVPGADMSIGVPSDITASRLLLQAISADSSRLLVMHDTPVTLVGGSGWDLLFGSDGDDSIEGVGGQDSLWGGWGNDTLIGGNEQDQLRPGDGADLLDGGPGTDVVDYGIGPLEGLRIDLEAQLFSGAAGDDTLRGIEVFIGTAFDDTMLGDGGANSLTGGAGMDQLEGRAGGDSLAGSEGNDTLRGGADADRVSGDSGADVLFGDDGADTLHGGWDDDPDTLQGAAGDDTYHVQGGIADVVIEEVDGGVDLIVVSGVGYTLPAHVERLEVIGPGSGTGNGQNNLVTAGAGSTVDGGAGNDTLVSSASALLRGGAGDDVFLPVRVRGSWNWEINRSTLEGGLGADRFDATGAPDVVVSYQAGATSGVVIDLQMGVVGGAAANDTLTGVHRLIGTDHADQLTGTLGNSELHGAGGDDLLTGRQQRDLLTGGTGADTLLGDLGEDTLSGAQGNDQLSGGMGSDVLDGGGGADTMTGGGGADSYRVDHDGDVLLELADVDLDTVTTTLASYTLPVEVERLVRAVGGTGIGNALANWMVAEEGIAGAVVLLGEGGADRLEGALGADLLRGGEGDDDLIGWAGSDTLEGGDGDDGLNGSAETHHEPDRLIGGAGDDYYEVDHEADAVVELAGEGYDRVNIMFGASHVLAANVEMAASYGDSEVMIAGNDLHNLLHAGSGNDTLVGGRGDDTLVSDAAGGNGNDVLDGGTGADLLQGGRGDDRYYVGRDDRIEEEVAAGGHDTVISSVDLTLHFAMEDLQLMETAITANGNSLHNRMTGNAMANALRGGSGNDTLVGNSGADTLDGGTGADLMIGGLGGDTYRIGAGDSILEVGAGGGHDTAISSVNLTLHAAVEDVQLVGSATVANGNNTHNRMTGNALANVLQGGQGNDTLIGMAGDDTLVGGKGRDSLTGGDGNDTFKFTNIRDSAASAADTVSDLQAGDRLDVALIDANTLLAGDQAFTHVAAYSNQAGQLILTYDSGQNRTEVAVDVNGDSTPDMVIQLTGQHTSTAGWLL